MGTHVKCNHSTSHWAPKQSYKTNKINQHGISRRTFPALNILCLPKSHNLSERRSMYSYYNKLLPNHFDDYFISMSSIHSHSIRLSTSNNLFLPRVKSSSGKYSLTFVGLKVWSSMPDDIKSATTYAFKWKLKKHLHGKDTQLWTLPTFHLSRTKYYEFWYFIILFILCIFSCLSLFFPVHIPFLSAWKSPPYFFSGLLCFFLVPH